jgi:phage baseplate assembly protein V
MSYNIAELDRRLAALLQAGTVDAVDYDKARCRVRVGEWVSAWLPWASLGAGKVRNWRPPSVGEQALVLSPSGDPANGFAFAGFYSDQHSQANDNRPNTVAWCMPDGCVIEYDWETGALRVAGSKTVSVENAETIHVASGGQVTLQCPSLVIDCPSTTINGDVSVNGDLNATGAVMDGGGNSNHHTH